MIKNIEDFPNVQIVCRNTQQVKDCANYLKKLGYDFAGHIDNTEDIIILINNDSKKFFSKSQVSKNLYVEFYNKELVKILQKFIKQKEEKEKVEDFEVAEDGRIIKINNYKSEKEIFVACDWEYIENGIKISDMAQIYLDFCLKYGLAYATPEARDRAMFKLEIETKLKNIAERLNKGQKIDWNNAKQEKFVFLYHVDSDEFYTLNDTLTKIQGGIYCLDENFRKTAIKEIGEENLFKYFME